MQTIIILSLMVCYIAYIIYESLLVKYLRKQFKYVIHVNGIRGKSTTTRLIDAGLRNCGFKVFCKTTGTIPTMINTSNKDVAIHRLGSANIREQISMMKKAKKEGADVLVLECMAVNPELQRICEEQILHADVCVITNVREDHIQEMGNDLNEIASAFCNTIPQSGILVINKGPFEKVFQKEAKKKNTTVFVTKEFEGKDNLGTFPENIACALSVCESLNLDKELFFSGMQEYHKDFGAYEELQIENTLFVNGLSINDPESIKMVYDELIKKVNPKDITILLNNRADRPTRVLQHMQMLSLLKAHKVLLFGSNAQYVKRKIVEKNKNISVEILKNLEDIKNEKIIFAVGNIGGVGMKLLEYARKEGKRL